MKFAKLAFHAECWGVLIERERKQYQGVRYNYVVASRGIETPCRTIHEAFLALGEHLRDARLAGQYTRYQPEKKIS